MSIQPVNAYNWQIVSKEIEANRHSCILIVDNLRNNRIQKWKPQLVEFINTHKIRSFIMPFEDPKWKPERHQIPFINIARNGVWEPSLYEEDFTNVEALLEKLL